MVALAPNSMPVIKGKENKDEERIFLPLRMFPAKFLYIF